MCSVQGNLYLSCRVHPKKSVELMEARVGLSSFGQFQNFCYNLLQPVEVSELLKSQTPNTRANCRPVSRGGGGQGGQLTPP